MRCPRCQHENPPGSNFCLGCGARFGSSCSSCGNELPAGSRFCNKCGTPVALESPRQSRFSSPESYTPKHLADKILISKSALQGERKNLTVLFADLANSTALAERLGPEAMHAFLSRVFELALAEVHRYEGTVNQFLGDGLMALFGAPIAHEDHARRAVLAALGIQRSLREPVYGERAVVRMGLNTGPVVVGSIGDNLRMDYTAVGDTTNLAARLQQLAEPGTVLLGEATHRLVRDMVRVESLGPINPKGKTEAVTAHRLVGLGPRRSPLGSVGDRALSRFVGRERELVMLLELLQQAESGHGQVVGLVGDPGVGKSRVVYEFRHALGDRRVTVLEGRCLSYGSAIPYLPILDIVRANCGIVDTDTPEVVSEKVSAGLDELQIDARKNASYILYALGLKESTESLILLSGQAIKERTFDVLREMSVRGSRRRPLIFVVEDLHWIDTTSEEFLASLIERLPGVPILLLMTSRPGYRSPWSDKSYATQISLRPLSEEEGLGVVRSILMNRGVAESATPMILERAGGNPLFLEELSRAVLEHGAAEGLYSIPDTIQGVLMARIDRLPDEAKRLLQSAAVLGREFSPRLLSAVWDGSDVEPLITDLRRSEFLYERSHGDDSVYVFKHALTQEVAYASILTAHRERLHAVAGEVLERLHAERLEEVYDRLAFHFSKTKMIEKAVEYLSRLAERAARSYAHAEAVLAFTDAVALAERLPIAERDRRVLELILHQAQSFHYLGRRQELVDILEQYQERLERLGDQPLTGRYYSRLGFAYSFLGDRGRAGSAVMKAIAAAEECGDGVTLGTALVSVGMEKLWGGKVEEGIELLRRSIELLTPANEHESLGFAYYAMAWGQATRGDFDDARAVLDRLDAIGEATGDPRLQCNAATVRGWVEISTGEFTMGLGLLRYALERAPDPFEAALALGFLGYAHLESGEVGEATAVLERAVQEADKFRSRQVRAWFRTHLGEAYLARGQTEAAGDLCRQALDLSNEAQWRFGIAIAKRLLGRIAHASGAADADLYIREALVLALELGVRHDVAHCHRVLGELYRQTGKRDQAREHLSAAITMYREIGMRYWLEKAEAGMKAVG